LFNVCSQCGLYRADKVIEVDADGSFAVCPECGYRHPFLRLPLLIIGGASGTGKSTASARLAGKIPGAVVLESDILWNAYYADKERYAEYFNTWLRMCKNISQSGQAVALFGAGLGVPGNIEGCVERRYFSRVHYLALVCDDDVLVERLRARPAWRGSAEDEWLSSQSAFNRWYKEEASRGEPPVDLLDTTRKTVEESVLEVEAWIKVKRAGV
jgi:hypothetical protein